MEEFLKYNKLFDCYESLLTNNEKEIFQDYFANDLSLKEIAEEKCVSRSAIHKTIKNVKEKLDFYESNLRLCQLLEKIDKLNESNDIESFKREINKIIED